MCFESDHITLSAKNRCQISYCRSCKSFSLIFRSSSASFLFDEMRQFKWLLVNLTDRDFQYNFFNEPHAILRTQNSFIGFCLTKPETREIIEAVSEAETLYEAFHIIYN
jgi:hypothetical protein